MGIKEKIYEAQLRVRQSFINQRFKSSLRAAGRDHVSKPKNDSNLLFVLAGLIGDSVMSLPPIVEARRIWPGARITVLGKKHNRELLTACPLIDEFYECNADPFSLRKSAEIKGLQKWLDGAAFDAALILLGDQFAHMLAKAKIPIRVGVRGTALEACLTHTYDIGSPRTWGARERLNCLRVLGYEVEDATPRLWVDADAATTAQSKLADEGLKAGDGYAVLHPFGSTRRQWWDLTEAEQLARSLNENRGLSTVLIGGKETVKAASSIARHAVIDTTGVLELPELLAVIDGARLVVTTDSGPFHMAGALGKPTIGLFRERRPEHAAAYPTATTVFGRDESCRTTCVWDRCAADPCRQMGKITAGEVMAAIKQAV